MINIIKNDDNRMEHVYQYLKLFYETQCVFSIDDIKDGILVLPIIGVDSALLIKDTDIFLDDLTKKAKIDTIFTGIANEALIDFCLKNEIRLIKLLDFDDVRSINAYLTAEGLMSIIISKVPFTLNNCNILLLGYGYCGKEIKKLLDAFNANVYIYSNNYKDSVKLDKLNYDIIINTIPSLILDSKLLENLDSIIFDISSFPYGIDIEYANKNNLKYYIESNIPKRFSPLSAGIIIGKKIKEIID